MPSKAHPALETCQRDIGYSFRDTRLLEAAVTHSSSAATRHESYERMEFLGDAVLGLVICQYLYEKLPDLMEGDLTKIKSAVVSRRVCARAAERIHLGNHLRLGQGMDNGHHMPRSMAAAALEAVIAAVYYDGGLGAARDFVLRIFGPDLDSAIRSENQFNYKSQLQQHAQRELRASPEYDLLDEKGPDHSKCFEIAVTIGHRQFPGAWGPTKKEAEQKAARVALIELGVIDPDSPDPDEHTIDSEDEVEAN